MGDQSAVRGMAQLLSYDMMLISGALFVVLVFLQGLQDDLGMNQIGLLLLMLVLALGLLITSAEFFIQGAKGIARRVGLAEVVIGLTVVSIGTSLPEILVTSAAAYDIPKNQAVADLAVGSILGSVLVQITLILGIVTATQGVRVHPTWLKRDGLVMLLAVLVLGFFLWTGNTLSRIEGAILVLSYIAYVTHLILSKDKIQTEVLESDSEGESDDDGVLWTTMANSAMVIFGLILALFAAHHLVNLAAYLAGEFGVSEAVIGTTVSGIGTSLPELTIALLAAKKSEGVAIGTLVGSNITDPTMSVGIAALVHPLTMTTSGASWALTIILPATILSVAIALAFMYTSYEFHKWEGYSLIAVYLAFLLLLEYIRRAGIY